jgi:alanyl-tRNA synthetase
VLALYREGASVTELQAGEEGVVVLDRTPFYAESGGQVGDAGVLTSGHGRFEVQDTQKVQAEVFGHKGVLKAGRLAVGDQVTAGRRGTARSRRSQPLRHAPVHTALRTVLGRRVQLGVRWWIRGRPAQAFPATHRSRQKGCAKSKRLLPPGGPATWQWRRA